MTAALTSVPAPPPAKKKKKSRARKVSTVPTRIYSYGALMPVEGADLLEVQIRLGAAYYNALVEIENRKRDRQRAISAWWPEVARAEAARDERLAAHAEATRLLKAAKAGAGKRARIAVEQDWVRDAKASLAEAKETLRLAREFTKTDARRQICLKWCEELAKEEGVVVYGRMVTRGIPVWTTRDGIPFLSEVEGASGPENGKLFWGTSLQMAEALKQAAQMTAWPNHVKFKRYDGTGKIAVQIQGVRRASEFMAGKDTRVRMGGRIVRAHHPHAVHRRLEREIGEREASRRKSVSIRVASTEKKKPIWVTFPVIWHREIPPDAQIKWAWVLRRKVGIRYEYRFQISLESETFRPKAARTHGEAVAINFGWRRHFDGGQEKAVRVAYFLDTAGNRGEILLPERTRTGLDKPRDLHSIRDKHFDEIKSTVTQYKVQAGASAVSAVANPALDWLREQTVSITRWRSPGKMVALMRRWKLHRHAGDQEVVEAIEAWAKQDRHLYAWESHQRDRRVNHRRDFYQVVADRFSKVYSTIVVAKKMAMKKVRSKPEPAEGDPSDGRDIRRTADMAAPAELAEAIVAGVGKYGTKLVKIPSPYITQTCHACGHCPDEPWDAAPKIEHACGACGAVWDQDMNACVNMLLLASGELPPRIAQALAETKAA